MSYLGHPPSSNNSSSLVLRKTQTCRILIVVALFFLLASMSRYQNTSIEFSIDEDGQVQTLPEDAGEDDIYYTHHIATYETRDLKRWTEGDSKTLLTPEGKQVVQFLVSSTFKTPFAHSAGAGSKGKDEKQDKKGKDEQDDNRDEEEDDEQEDLQVENEDNGSLVTTSGGGLKNSINSQHRYQGPRPLVDNVFLILAKRLRVYRALRESLESYYRLLEDDDQQNQFYVHPPENLAPNLDLFQRMEKETFPWLLKQFPTTFDLAQQWTISPKDDEDPVSIKGAGNKRKGGKGIVLCVGNRHSIYARTTVKALREVLKTGLPIEIFYAGPTDLSAENRAWFEQFEDVTTVDITTLVDQDLVRIQGPVIKPFAMLVSRFQEVILLDADVSFLQDPSVLFEDGGYKEVGTVFFYDRTIAPSRRTNQNAQLKRQWIGASLPSVSNHPAKTRWFKLKGDQDLDAGVVVMDKKRHLVGLLAICKMNDFHERNHPGWTSVWPTSSARSSAGAPKDVFWIGLEMVQERYSFVRFGAGIVGDLGDAVPYKHVLSNAEDIDRWYNGNTVPKFNPQLQQLDQQNSEALASAAAAAAAAAALAAAEDFSGVQQPPSKANPAGSPSSSSTSLIKTDRVCGNSLHFTFQGVPLWWNHGLVRDPSTDNSPYLKYTAYMRDEHGIWDLTNSCLVQSGGHGAVKEVEWHQRQTAFEYLRVDREVAVELDQPKVKNVLAVPRLVRGEGAKGGRGNTEAV